MITPIETMRTKSGKTVKIFYEEDPINPREDYDCLGHMVAWHRNYQIGDKHAFKTPEEFNKKICKKLNYLVLPLYLFDHSGLRISTDDSMFRACDSQKWDWGPVGYIYVSNKEIREEYGLKRITNNAITKAANVLRAEVETYDMYISGDVYRYEVVDESGNVIDSCGNFIGIEYLKEEIGRMD